MRSRFKKVWLILQLFMVPVFSFSQGEFNNWYFGNYAGVTFNSGVPVYLTDGMELSAGYNVCFTASAGVFLFS